SYYRSHSHPPLLPFPTRRSSDLTLDSSRYRYQLSKRLGASPADLNAIVIGGHGDTTMIPLIKHATWNSLPVTQFLSAEEQQQIVADTMVGGATLTKLIGTSAWYA